MIFVSYSAADSTWLKRFLVTAKPLEANARIRCWSDRDIKPGRWERQIEEAMAKAAVAVLLVSAEFLASDYIMKKEVPYLLKAHEQRNLPVLWLYVSPCLFDMSDIAQFQAVRSNGLKPLVAMGEWEWRESFVKACRIIDEEFMRREKPVISAAFNGKVVQQKEAGFSVLAKPAMRQVEVLVYAGDKQWHRQAPIRTGSRETTCYFGNKPSKSAPGHNEGSEYKVVALTTARPLKHLGKYPNLPEHRTRSEEITVKRG